MEAKDINTRSEGDCGYIALYMGKKIGIWAPTKAAAQEAAAKHFKAKKTWKVDVYLCVDSNNEQVTHVCTD